MAAETRLPKVSCLMVTADREQFFRRSLLSYGRQTYPHKELIIFADSSRGLARCFHGSNTWHLEHFP